MRPRSVRGHGQAFPRRAGGLPCAAGGRMLSRAGAALAPPALPSPGFRGRCHLAGCEPFLSSAGARSWVLTRGVGCVWVCKVPFSVSAEPWLPPPAPAQRWARAEALLAAGLGICTQRGAGDPAAWELGHPGSGVGSLAKAEEGSVCVPVLGAGGSGSSWFPRDGIRNARKPQASHVRLQTPVEPLLALLRAGGSALGALHHRHSHALDGSPHTSAPQEAGGAAVLLPTPFPCSKSKSLFLWSFGCWPAVRQPDGKAQGLSSLPCSLAADVLSTSLGLPLELCQALGVLLPAWS